MVDKKIKDEELPLFFDRYLKGETLRDLSKGKGFSHVALSYRFAAEYGEDYADLTRNIYNVVKSDYLKSRRYTERQKQEIEAWLESLSTEQLIPSIRLFSNKEVRNRTENTVNRDVDVRALFDRYANFN